MEIKNAKLILERLKEGEYIAAKEDPENISFLENTGLVSLNKNRIVLTPEGRRAAEMGIETYFEYRKTEKEILGFSPEKCRKNSRILLLIFFLLFTIFLTAVFSSGSLPAIF